MAESQEPTAIEFIQAFIAIPAVALALATFSEERSPIIQGRPLFPISLTIGGLIALLSCLYAMSILLEDMELSTRDLLPIPLRKLSHAQSTVIIATWGLWGIAITFIFMLFSLTP